MKLFPSIASADPLEIGEVIKKLNWWPYLHIDIEDGNFTSNITFGMRTVEAICKAARGQRIQVHLMVTHPESYLDDLAALNVDAVIAQVEALDYPMRFLNRCRALGMKAGLAVNMKTSLEEIKIFQERLDQILLMTSEPDSVGENLYEPALNRVIDLAGKIPGGVELYADGGITREALLALSRAGVHGAVLGRLVFQAVNPIQILRELGMAYDLVQTGGERLPTEGEEVVE